MIVLVGPCHFGVMHVVPFPGKTVLLMIGAATLLQEVVIVGGLEMQSQAKALARRPHVVVATPGRLKVGIMQCFGQYAMQDS